MYPQQQPQQNPGMTFLGMSGGILMLAMALVIILPILGCVACGMLGVFGAAVPVEPLNSTPTPSPDW